MHIALPSHGVPLKNAGAAVRGHELGVARSMIAGPCTIAAARIMQCAPDQHVVTGIGTESVDPFDYRAGDHAGFDLRVPANIGCEREMVDDVFDANNILAVFCTRAMKGRFGIRGEPVNLLSLNARIVERGSTCVQGQGAEWLLRTATEFGIANPNDGRFPFTLPHRILRSFV